MINKNQILIDDTIFINECGEIKPACPIHKNILRIEWIPDSGRSGYCEYCAKHYLLCSETCYCSSCVKFKNHLGPHIKQNKTKWFVNHLGFYDYDIV